MEKRQVTLDEHITQLEKTLMTGRGGWIADFNESSRNVKLDDVLFDALVEGNTRMRGFLLSRLFSFLLNPNYSVCCFILSSRSARKVDAEHLQRALSAIRSHMKHKVIRWSWLFIFSDEKTQKLKRTIEGIGDQNIGVVLADIHSKETSHSNSYIGKQAKRFIKI